jgi:hypothetical protein
MHTLSRAITAQWFTEPADFHQLRAHWRSLIQSDRRHTLTAEHHLLYQALLGRDWRRGFTPPTRASKLANNGFADWRLWLALARLHSRYSDERVLAPFDGLVTPAMLEALRLWLPAVVVVTEFAGGAFPFDAYVTPAGWPPAPQAEAAHA